MVIFKFKPLGFLKFGSLAKYSVICLILRLVLYITPCSNHTATLTLVYAQHRLYSLEQNL